MEYKFLLNFMDNWLGANEQWRRRKYIICQRRYIVMKHRKCDMKGMQFTKDDGFAIISAFTFDTITHMHRPTLFNQQEHIWCLNSIESWCNRCGVRLRAICIRNLLCLEFLRTPSIRNTNIWNEIRTHPIQLECSIHQWYYWLGVATEAMYSYASVK